MVFENLGDFTQWLVLFWGWLEDTVLLGHFTRLGLLRRMFSQLDMAHDLLSSVPGSCIVLLLLCSVVSPTTSLPWSSRRRYRSHLFMGTLIIIIVMITPPPRQNTFTGCMGTCQETGKNNSYLGEKRLQGRIPPRNLKGTLRRLEMGDSYHWDRREESHREGRHSDRTMSP